MDNVPIRLFYYLYSSVCVSRQLAAARPCLRRASRIASAALALLRLRCSLTYSIHVKSVPVSNVAIYFLIIFLSPVVVLSLLGASVLVVAECRFKYDIWNH